MHVWRSRSLAPFTKKGLRDSNFLCFASVCISLSTCLGCSIETFHSTRFLITSFLFPVGLLAECAQKSYTSFFVSSESASQRVCCFLANQQASSPFKIFALFSIDLEMLHLSSDRSFETVFFDLFFFMLSPKAKDLAADLADLIALSPSLRSCAIAFNAMTSFSSSGVRIAPLFMSVFLVRGLLLISSKRPGSLTWGRGPCFLVFIQRTFFCHAVRKFFFFWRG